MKINTKTENSLSHSRLLEVLDYNYNTGVFIWKISTARVIKVGSVAGNLDKSSGYLRIQIDKKRFLAHRLAWFYCFKEWPENMIDHKDTNKTNNILDNLRDADNSSNNQNRGLSITNTSGYRGVSLDTNNGKYKVQFVKNGTNNYLGEYITIEEAVIVYNKAAKLSFGEFYNESTV